jgi:hypothetical protein
MYQTFNVLIKKKFDRLLIPFIVVGVLWMQPIRYAIHYPLLRSGADIISLFLENVFMGKDPGSLWFLLMLFNVFIIFYFIEKIFSFNLIPYVILLMTLGCFCYIHFHGWTFDDAASLFQNKATVKYFPFFCLGYLLRRYYVHVKPIFIKKRSFIFAFLIHFAMCIIVLKGNIVNQNTHLIRLYFEVLGPILSIIAWYGLVNYILNSNLDICNNKVMKLIEKNSFAIYVFHEPVVLVILSYLVKQQIRPIILVSICFFMSISISILIKTAIEKLRL